MKKILLLSILLAAFSLSASATLWRVNNTAGVDADFTTLSAAITGASAGDTIYIEPSATSVGGGTLDKKLILIGNGFFLTTPTYPISSMNNGLQANMTSSKVSDITFGPGSNQSTIMGLEVGGSVYVYVSDIHVKRCYIYGYIYLGNYQSNSSTYISTSNIDIRQNYVYQGILSYYFSTQSGTVGISNVNIQNNILTNYSYKQISLPTGISGFFMNNVISTPYYALDLFNFQINNNIAVGNSYYNSNNNVAFNNVANNSCWGTANNNLANVTPASLFQNYGTGSADSNYILSPTGPGVGAGFNGVDVGPYGGPDPYRKSGIPPVPSIYLFTAPATTTGTTLPVTISTRSND